MAARTAGTAGSAHIPVGGHIALAEGVEFVAYRQHEVAGEVVDHRVVDIVGGDGAAYVGALVEKVVGLQSHGERTARQELIGDRGVPHPLFLVVACGIACRTRIGQIGVEYHSYRGGVVGRECASVGVDGLAADTLQRVVGGLKAVVGAKFKLQVVRTESYAEAFGHHKRSGAVALAVVEAYIAVVVDKQVVVDLPEFIAQRL